MQYNDKEQSGCVELGFSWSYRCLTPIFHLLQKNYKDSYILKETQSPCASESDNNKSSDLGEWRSFFLLSVQSRFELRRAWL